MSIKILLFTALLTVIQGTEGLVIELGDGQNNGYIIQNSCTYFFNYTTFDENDCLLPWYNPGETAWDGTVGTWGPCYRQQAPGVPIRSCDIVYFGRELKYPESIVVHGRVSGQGSITASAKASILLPDSSYKAIADLEFESADPTDPSLGDWTEREVLYPRQHDSLVVKFTVSVPNNESFAMIDKIIVTTGDVETTTTTPEPIRQYVFDTAADLEASHWSATCAHAENPQDFWIYGCDLPEGILVERYDALGWWQPCSRMTCDFVFDSTVSTQRPLRITIDGEIHPGSVVNIYRKKSTFGATYKWLKSDQVTTKLAQWSYTMPNDCSFDTYKVSVDNTIGPVLIDKVTVVMKDGNEGNCTGSPDPTDVPPSTAKTTTSATTTVSTMSTESTTAGTETVVLTGLLIPIFTFLALMH